MANGEAPMSRLQVVLASVRRRGLLETVRRSCVMPVHGQLTDDRYAVIHEIDGEAVVYSVGQEADPG